MKDFARLLIVFLAIVLTGVQSIAAQDNEVKTSEKEIDALFEKADCLMSKLSKREVVVSQYYESSKVEPSYESTTIHEVAPFKGSRIVSRVRSANGYSETERIWIGENVYSKNEKGIWKQGDPQWQGVPEGFVVSSLPMSWIGPPHKPREVVTTVRANANVMVDGRPLDFYEITKVKSKDGVIEETSISQTWFNEDGTLSKTLFEQYTTDGKLRRRDTSSLEYEDIRIEEPKID